MSSVLRLKISHFRNIQHFKKAHLNRLVDEEDEAVFSDFLLQKKKIFNDIPEKRRFNTIELAMF